MSSDSNQENSQQNEVTGDDATKKALTYKDWKTLKESQSKPNEQQNTKSYARSKGNSRNAANDLYNNGFMGSPAPDFRGMPNFFADNSRRSGFMPPNYLNNFNGIHGFNNFGSLNNEFSFNKFSGPNNNNFNRQNNFGGNNFSNEFNHLNGSNNFGNGRNSYNSFNNGDNLDLPDKFFASDGIYRQKDLMQTPLPNPFRNDLYSEQLLNEFDRRRYTKDYKKKKGNNNTAGTNKTTSASKVPEDTLKLNNEPKVYVPNPKAKVDGKPYIPKPKVPEQNLEISKEEKKQQWKEFREAMKPFKNREFYNAKRVVQRLGKKAPSELEEKEIIRLANAQKIMAAHKANLTIKYPNYIKAEESSNQQGELYVLNRQSIKYPNFVKPKQCENFGNFGSSGPSSDFEPGRKILGGYTGFQGFVPGETLEVEAASMTTQ